MKSVKLLLFVAFCLFASAVMTYADDPKLATQQKRSITLNMKKGEIADALRLVAEQGGLNLVIGPEVKGEVSVYLTDATLETALKAIAVNNGFSYRVDDGVITVAKVLDKPPGAEVAPPTITRVFTLRSQDAERVKDALEFALSKWGKMKVLNQNSHNGYGVQRLSSLGGEMNPNNNGASGGGYNGGGGYGSGGMQNNSMGMSGAATGPGGNGNVTQGQDQARNARTLVVTDTEESVERIGRLVADLDRLPPQVLIEARIVEMSTDLQRQLGIDWNVSAMANGPILNHEWPIRNRAGFASGSQIRRTADGAAIQSSGLALGTVDFSQFSAMAQANQDDTSIRLLANPRLLVYNNHSASILVGERYPILQANISNFGTATESLQTYIPVGVQLEVTPTIMMDGTISMLVHPATSALGDDVIGTTGLHVARITTRELDTRAIMHDGQTIVLGGLISDRKTHRARKVPGLGDIPVLDVIFRQESPHAERVDLLVFLTAHIESATEISERDQKVFDMYKPHFKQIQRVQDVPLHFEIPTEYEPPKPMFSDPPAESDDSGDAQEDQPSREPVRTTGRSEHAESSAKSQHNSSTITEESTAPVESSANSKSQETVDQKESPETRQNLKEEADDGQESTDNVPKSPPPSTRSPSLKHVKAQTYEWLQSKWAVGQKAWRDARAENPMVSSMPVQANARLNIDVQP